MLIEVSTTRPRPGADVSRIAFICRSCGNEYLHKRDIDVHIATRHSEVWMESTPKRMTTGTRKELLFAFTPPLR